jgi:hypothetical protein
MRAPQHPTFWCAEILWRPLLLISLSSLTRITSQTCSSGNYISLNCPSGFSLFPGSSNCYRYFSTLSTWYAAQAACVSQGWHLVTIQSESENSFVATLQVYGVAWIGYYLPIRYADHGTGWVWTETGTNLNGYTDWCPGEPNDGGGGTPQQNCASMYGSRDNDRSTCFMGRRLVRKSLHSTSHILFYFCYIRRH